MPDPDFNNQASAEEPILRFLLHSRWIHKPTQTVKHLAYSPAFVDDRFELSTYRVGDSSTDDDIQKVGSFVADASGKNLHGVANARADSYFANGLELSTDNDPRPGHTNATGWPDEKSARKAISQELARQSELKRYR